MITLRSVRLHVVLVPLLLMLLASLVAPIPAHASARISIQGTKFLINGVPTYPGTAIEGRLMNSRMVQAVFHDENSSTAGYWKYPDTGRWDPARNTNEFVAALPTYKAYGLNAVTVGLQGGLPKTGVGSHPWNINAFNSDGSLKSAWMSRLGQVIRAANNNDMIVLVSLFYFGQDQRLSGETAVKNAVDRTVDWIRAQGFGNVMLEIGNESNHTMYDHAILRGPRVHELIARAQQRSGGTIPVSTSFLGGQMPTAAVRAQADYILLHGNKQTTSGISSMVSQIKASAEYKAEPKPIVFNEDSTSIPNMNAAVNAGASWGYYDQGSNDYANGYQAPPVRWGVNTTAKKNFFSRVAYYAQTGASSPSPTPSPSPTSSTIDVEYRVNAGGPLVTGWARDTSSAPAPQVNAAETGNKTYGTTATISLNHSSIPSGTPQAVFKHERADVVGGAHLKWDFRVSPGTYEVRLYFAEIYSGAQAVGRRVFDVRIEDRLVLDNYDIYANVGGYKGVMKSFVVTSSSELDVDFVGVKDVPAIKAIEIIDR